MFCVKYFYFYQKADAEMEQGPVGSKLFWNKRNTLAFETEKFSCTGCAGSSTEKPVMPGELIAYQFPSQQPELHHWLTSPSVQEADSLSLADWRHWLMPMDTLDT